MIFVIPKGQEEIRKMYNGGLTFMLNYLSFFFIGHKEHAACKNDMYLSLRTEPKAYAIYM